MWPGSWCVALKDFESYVIVINDKIENNMFVIFDIDNRPIKKYKRAEIINLLKGCL